MKKLFTSIAIIIAAITSAQTSWSERDYSTEVSPDELQVTIVPISLSSNQELNQVDVSWRRGFWSFGGRYGVDNDRTHYYDINAKFYFYITPHLDLTMGAGYGRRIPKITVSKDYEKNMIPISFGIIGKPIRQVQFSFTVEKMVPDNVWYYQGGIMFLFNLNKK